MIINEVMNWIHLYSMVRAGVQGGNSAGGDHALRRVGFPLSVEQIHTHIYMSTIYSLDSKRPLPFMIIVQCLNG
jgi:hypothetical protein